MHEISNNIVMIQCDKNRNWFGLSVQMDGFGCLFTISFAQNVLLIIPKSKSMHFERYVKNIERKWGNLNGNTYTYTVSCCTICWFAQKMFNWLSISSTNAHMKIHSYAICPVHMLWTVSYIQCLFFFLSFFSRFFHRCLSQSLPSIHIIYGYHKLFHHVTDIYLSFLESWILIAWVLSYRACVNPMIRLQ